MKLRSTMVPPTLIAIGMMVIAGCAPYQILKPKPELISIEKLGYEEVKKDEKQGFKIKKDGKYAIAFPAPTANNFYIVLSLPEKAQYHSFMVDAYKGKQIGARLPDESLQPNTMSVYPVQASTPYYYLMLDSVKQEMNLTIQFRYAPQWRFKFENKAAAFTQTLTSNTVNRETYQTLGSKHHFENVNLGDSISTITRKAANLDGVHKELLAIESIFPSGIDQKDTAYVAYRSLRQKLEDEMHFQESYLLALGFFDKLQKSRGDLAAFMGFVEDFIAVFSQKEKFAPNVLQEAQSAITVRLNEIPAYYDGQLNAKLDATPLDSVSYLLKSFNRLPALYQSAALPASPLLSQLSQFMTDFDKNTIALNTAKEAFIKIPATINALATIPSNQFFPEIVAKTAAIQTGLPQPMGLPYGKYQQYKCVVRLNDEIGKLTQEITAKLVQYKQAESIVPAINGMAAQRDFKGAITLLKQNIGLDFVIEKYRTLDTLSVQEQSRQMVAGLSEKRWVDAESRLKALHEDQTFLFPVNVLGMKERMAGDLEDSLYTTIDRATRARVDKFLLDNVDTLQNVDSLYTDSAFLPLYNVTFSSGGRKELLQRKQELTDHLAKLKDNEFPAKAITLLFDQFTKNFAGKDGETNVLRCRAIVTHGKHYQGTDETVKRRVAECDPTLPKWITKPTEYRSLYVTPTTDKRRGKNKYQFRFNIKVPTEAQFPVYDVNIKLPKELAQNAGETQWYDEIKVNGKLLKNEGRFSITAPTAANNFECQATPVSVNKDGSNIAEVTFTADAFKVYQISIMVQKPIIKKN